MKNLSQSKAISAPAVILPVTLMDYSAVEESGNIKISWKTASEINVDYFDVEHSTDGSEFTSIGKVKAKNTQQLPTMYYLFDSGPTEGLNYYRLVEYDDDGNKTIYATKSVRFGSSLTGIFRIYPNPVTVS